VALVHDTPNTIADIFGEIQNNLYDLKLRWFTTDDINNSLQDSYNKIVALLGPIEHSTFIPIISEPYYDLRQIPDFMYVVGIYNPFTNLWLQGGSYREMKATFQTFLQIGQPRFMNIMDFNRILMWPYLPNATGVLYVLYKASAPPISPSHTPILPYGTGARLLEYFTTADLLEQSREFKKAQTWLSRAFDPGAAGKSIYQQCKNEIQELARMDRDLVLEPYRWIFNGGQFNGVNWINNEVPTGVIDGTNVTFGLAQVPNPTSSILLMKNGLVQFQGTNYTINGQTLTLSAAPQADGDTPLDSLRAWYQIP